MADFQRSGCFWALLFVLVGSIHAQSLEDRGYRPIEQMTGDMDPLARSFRRAEPGLGEQGGQATRVYRREGSDRLYYLSPGVNASYDRSAYSWFRISKKEWRLYQLIPPNTVFHIGTPTLPEAEPEPPSLPNDIRDGSRVESRIDASVLPIPDQPSPPDRRETQWARYQTLRKAHQRALLEALTEKSKAEETKPHISD